MKFIHTSDLHIGKMVNGFSTLEDQQVILGQILDCVREEQADAVFLCGDIYDRSVAPAAAVQVFDWFLTELSRMDTRVFVIAGNHDCGERVEFANGILCRSGVHMEGKPLAQMAWVDMEDSFGPLRIHLLPFARPAQVRLLYGCDCADFQESVRRQLQSAQILEGGRNLLLTHHFVIAEGQETKTCDSDSRLSVGGADQVDASLFQIFDYVALGHLHGVQQIGNGPVYYSGSPLKYSFSEVNQEKCVLVGTLGASGNLTVKRRPLKPRRDMRKIQGPLKELVAAGNRLEEGDPALQDYLLAVLTDEGEFVDPIGALRSVYPHVMQILFVSKEEKPFEMEAVGLRDRNPVNLYREFYRLTMDMDLTPEQEEIVRQAAEHAGEVTE